MDILITALEFVALLTILGTFVGIVLTIGMVVWIAVQTLFRRY